MSAIETPAKSATNATPTLRKYLETQRDAMLDFVRDLVNIESYATQVGGTNAVGDKLCDALEKDGFTTERVRGAPLAPERKWLEEFMLPGFDRTQLGFQRVARWSGDGHGRALILGDLDTAFVPGKGFPFSIDGDRALGPGIADMKGGLTVAVYALKALQATGLNNLKEITCVFSADEQGGSLDARKPIEDAAAHSDWVFCMECAREGGKLMGSRAQIGVAKLEVFGRDAHAGSAYAKGISAIEAMARKVQAIHALTDPSREIYLCVGQISGGWRRSVIPGYCMCTIDIRTPGPEAWEEVESKLRAIAGKRRAAGLAFEVPDRFAPSRRPVDEEDRQADRHREGSGRRVRTRLRRAALARRRQLRVRRPDGPAMPRRDGSDGRRPDDDQRAHRDLVDGRSRDVARSDAAQARGRGVGQGLMRTDMTDEATKKIHAWMQAHESELIAFLQRLVDIDSATELRDGVETVARLMEDTMRGIGFDVTRREVAPPPEQWIYDAFMADRGDAGIAPAVECRLRGGTGKGRLLMMGHIDTAFPVGAPATNPFRIDPATKRAYGPAVADMKGGDAGIVFACRALVETGVARPEQITVIFDTDEQGGSVRSRPLIEAEARQSDWGLVTEAGRVGGEAVGQRAGIAIGEIIIDGVEAHLGTGFRTGRSAIEAMCRKVIALHKLHDPDNGVLLNVGEFNGGTRRNLYAGRCVARMDIRCVDMAAWERTKASIEAIAAANDLPGTTTTLKLQQHRPPMPWTPQTRRMAELVRETGAAIGANIDTIATMGGSDANIIASQGVPTLCGLGPVGGAIMTRDEYIELPTLVERAALVAALAHKLGTGGVEVRKHG